MSTTRCCTCTWFASPRRGVVDGWFCVCPRVASAAQLRVGLVVQFCGTRGRGSTVLVGVKAERTLEMNDVGLNVGRCRLTLEGARSGRWAWPPLQPSFFKLSSRVHSKNPSTRRLPQSSTHPTHPMRQVPLTHPQVPPSFQFQQVDHQRKQAAKHGSPETFG